VVVHTDQVNHGGVQNPSVQVSLYKSHTTEEFLMETLLHDTDPLVLLPPHQRVCVVGHLLHFHVGLKLRFPFERGRVEIHGCG
jgi:hypothetical protein